MNSPISTWLRDLSIGRKLALLILATTAIVLVMACAAFVGHEVVASRQALRTNVNILADVLGQNTTAALQFDDPATAESILLALKAEPHIVAAAVFSKDGKRFATYQRPGAQAGLPATAEADGTRFEADRLITFRPIQMEHKRVGTIYLHADLGAIHEHTIAFIQIAGWVLLAAACVAFALSFWLQRLIARPILTLAEVARSITENRDYSVRAAVQGHNEIGLLTESLNQMLTDIDTSQHALQDANRSLQAQAAQITDSVAVLGSAAQEILAFTTQVTASATEIAASVTQTSTTVEEVRQTAQVANDKAKRVAASAQKNAQISQAGWQSTNDTIAGMKRIRQQMESIADSMMRLSDQTQAIGQIIATVDDLASQSTLLAVNAAIEAAKAGEHGKGFSVVAQEVKTLAEQSRAATKQVRTILNDIQKATTAAVMATEQGTKAVESGVTQSTKAGEAIQSLTNSVTESSQAALQIAVSSQQQLVGVDQVAAAMTSIKEASTQNVTSAKQLESSARNLNELGQRLNTLVTRDRKADAPS